MQSDAAYQVALVAYGAADYQAAIKHAEAAVAADPQNWQAWQLDGNARYALGDKAGALTVYRYALRINPNNPQLKAFADQVATELPLPSSIGKAPPADSELRMSPSAVAPVDQVESSKSIHRDEAIGSRTASSRLSISIGGGYSFAVLGKVRKALDQFAESKQARNSLFYGPTRLSSDKPAGFFSTTVRVEAMVGERVGCYVGGTWDIPMYFNVLKYYAIGGGTLIDGSAFMFSPIIGVVGLCYRVSLLDHLTIGASVGAGVVRLLFGSGQSNSRPDRQQVGRFVGHGTVAEVGLETVSVVSHR